MTLSINNMKMETIIMGRSKMINSMEKERTFSKLRINFIIFTLASLYTVSLVAMVNCASLLMIKRVNTFIRDIGEMVKERVKGKKTTMKRTLSFTREIL